MEPILMKQFIQSAKQILQDSQMEGIPISCGVEYWHHASGSEHFDFQISTQTPTCHIFDGKSPDECLAKMKIFFEARNHQPTPVESDVLIEL